MELTGTKRTEIETSLKHKRMYYFIENKTSPFDTEIVDVVPLEDFRTGFPAEEAVKHRDRNFPKAIVAVTVAEYVDD